MISALAIRCWCNPGTKVCLDSWFYRNCFRHESIAKDQESLRNDFIEFHDIAQYVQNLRWGYRWNLDEYN